MRLTRFALALAALAALAPSGVSAADLTREQVHEADAFAINNTWFVLYHEMGHMLIDQLGIPVLGREEDAVDNVAAMPFWRAKARKPTRR